MTEQESEGLLARGVTQTPAWCYRRGGSQTELIAESYPLAAVAAREMFARLGLDLNLDTVARVQARIGR